MYYLDHDDPILGGVMRYTVYLLMTMMLLSMIATFLDILWYYPTAKCLWARQRAPPVPEVMVSVKQFVNSNLLGGDIAQKDYADMDDQEVSQVDSESDIQDEMTHDHSYRKKKKRMNSISANQSFEIYSGHPSNKIVRKSIDLSTSINGSISKEIIKTQPNLPSKANMQ